MNKAYLLIGGNMGRREENLARARSLIAEHCGKVARISPLYETAAWGKTDQPPFLNQSLEIETSLPAKELLQELLRIEKDIGRTRKERYGPRIIDIDILLFGDTILNDPELKLPHPELQNRRFALQPLSDIAPAAVHPLFHKSIAQLLDECEDPLPVKKIWA